VGFSSDANMFS